MKSLCLIGFHKSMTTETYKILRDSMSLQVYNQTPWLYETGEPLYYSQIIAGVEQPPIYSNASDHVENVRKVLSVVPRENFLIRVVGYPYPLQEFKDKFNFFYVRRAIEDLIYKNYYGHRWFHALQVLPKYKSLHAEWKYIYSNMIGSEEAYEKFLGPLIECYVYLDKHYLSLANYSVWHHEMPDTHCISDISKKLGYKLRSSMPTRFSHLRNSIEKDIGAIRTTKQWLRIQTMCNEIRNENMF